MPEDELAASRAALERVARAIRAQRVGLLGLVGAGGWGSPRPAPPSMK
jgi:hypothetical protein